MPGLLLADFRDGFHDWEGKYGFLAYSTVRDSSHDRKKGHKA
jgi:hypothetical protein